MIDAKAINTELLEIIGHLGAALMQTIESDDQIIMGHVRDAHTVAAALRRQILGTAPETPMWSSTLTVLQIGDHDLEFRHDLCAVAAEMERG